MSDTAVITAYLTFGIGGDAYGIPLARVREVVACRTVVRVPNAGEFLPGVMNLRGSVVPVVDLARRLGVGATTLSDTSCAVLMDSNVDGEQTAIAGLVPEIRSVIERVAGDVAPPPEFGTPVDPRLVRGVASEGTQLVYLLDPDVILAGIA